jgi:ketosteroid isomerase-like protein
LGRQRSHNLRKEINRAAALNNWSNQLVLPVCSGSDNEFSMRGTLVLAVLTLTATSIALGQKQSASEDERSSIDQAIRRLDNERIQAQIHADAPALDRIYADDFIGVGPSGTVRTKPQVISDFTSGNLKFQSITTDEVKVRVYENTAVGTGLSTMVGQDKGKAVPRDTRFTRVWVKQQGHWRLVANHYSLQITQH